MAFDITDRVAVQELIARYAHLADSGQVHRIAEEIFADDATVDYGFGPTIGRESIRALFAGMDGHYHTSHLITNFIVDGEGDFARCNSHCLAWHWAIGRDVDGRSPLVPADLVFVGGYDDELRRQTAGWRITRRVLLQYGPGIGLGSADGPFRGVLEGCMGRRPAWP